MVKPKTWSIDHQLSYGAFQGNLRMIIVFFYPIPEEESHLRSFSHKSTVYGAVISLFYPSWDVSSSYESLMLF